jgi:hypothetical protein
VTHQAAVLGSSYAVTVTAEDAFGNAVPSYTGTVQLGVSSGTATLPASHPYTSADKGTHTFLITATSLGKVTLTAGDGSHNASLPVTVVSAATHLGVTVAQTKQTAGTSFQLTVTALDGTNKPDTNFSDTLHFAGAGGLSLDLPFTSTTGTQSFTVALTKSGTQTIAVTDPGRPAIKGTSPAITVSALGASQLVLTAPATPAMDGLPYTLAVIAEDQFANPASNYTGTLHFTVSGGTATVPTSLILKSASAKFAITPQSLGGLTVQASDGTHTGSAPITVVSAATHLAVAPDSKSAPTAGKPFTLTVSALSATGKPASPFTDVVHFADSLGNTGLPADAAFSGTGGQEQFTLTLPDAGKQTIDITDATRSTVGGVFLTVTVNPANNGTNPTAGVSGPTVGVPGQPLTFTLTATETGAAADAAYIYHIDWVGNGSVTQTVSGTSGLTVSHVYPATGSFTAKVTATDTAGDASTQAATQTVTVTATALENDPATGTNTALAIGCPAAGGTVLISPTSADGTDVAVTTNGAAQTLTGQPFTHLFVFGQAGKDVIQEMTQVIGNQTVSVAVPAVILGGSGSNTLSAAGSSASNVLIGGTGTSTLTGGSGRDILFGGGGAAALHAGSGGDILIAGTTVFDANVAALLALIQEWGRADISYTQRVADLIGTGAGGQNGTSFLTAQTIARDAAMNQLFGGTGPDWFWLSESGKTPDQLSGFVSREVLSLES